MEDKTSIASGIDITQLKADYDAACKRLLSEKIILAWIMKNCLAEYRDIDVKEIAEKYIEGTPFVSEVPVSPDETGPRIRGLAQDQSSPTEGSAYFDIYFGAIVPFTRELLQMIVNVEAQADYYPGYPLHKRGFFYCGRMISAQDGTVFVNSHYEKLRKACSIWVCTRPPRHMENTITRYYIAEENLVGDIHAKPEYYDLLSLVMICLGSTEKGNKGILKLLNVLLSSKVAPAEKEQILQDEFHIPMTQTLDREVSNMCNLSQVVWEEGEASGIKKGIKQGYETSLLASVKNLMVGLGLSVDEAMNVLRIPDADRKTYLAKLRQ